MVSRCAKSAGRGRAETCRVKLARAFLNVRILFDQGTPAPLRRHLRPHPVDTTAERNWSTISNGELLQLAEDEGYEVFITTDQNIRYQQNLTGRRLGIVVLMATSWPRTRRHLPEILAAVGNVGGGGYEEVPLDP